MQFKNVLDKQAYPKLALFIHKQPKELFVHTINHHGMKFFYGKV